MNKLIAIIAFSIATASSYAAPGRPDECGNIARLAFQTQKSRNMGLESFEDSKTFIDARMKQFKEIADEKIAQGMEPARAAKVLERLEKQTKFAARYIYIRSSTADPVQVRDYVNSMCLIDMDE